MTNLKLLAAAALVAISAPAFASDGGQSSTIDTKVFAFAAQGRTAGLVEGRNSTRVNPTFSKVEAATSQGFAPVDIEAILLRGSHR